MTVLPIRIFQIVFPDVYFATYTISIGVFRSVRFLIVFSELFVCDLYIPISIGSIRIFRFIYTVLYFLFCIPQCVFRLVVFSELYVSFWHTFTRSGKHMFFRPLVAQIESHPRSEVVAAALECLVHFVSGFRDRVA